MVKKTIWSFLVLAAISGFFVFGGNTIEVDVENQEEKQIEISKTEFKRADGDIENQKRLENPPEEIKALYMTNWVAGTPSIMENVLKVARDTEINAIVIDIKDYSGYVGFNTDLEKIIEYGAKEERIKNLNSLIKRLHNEKIYIISRISVFQDPRLVKARPDLAVKDKEGEVWKDRKGLSWADPSSKEVWDYNIDLAKEITARGIDEVNFDYIRFPSDGAGLKDLKYANWNGIGEKSEVIKSFFEYLRKNLEGIKISSDIFGQATVNYDDLGIGQIIEYAYRNFDYVAPMIYPSHYITTFMGFNNPAEHPYEVVKYSLETALSRFLKEELLIQREMMNSTTTPAILDEKSENFAKKKLRPWLQDFDLGAVYTVEMVQKQIKAVQDAGLSNSWMIWNPKNVYRKEIFKKTEQEKLE